MNTQSRHIKQMIPARATSDGAGVKIFRSIGQHQGLRLDPFLMLDQFFSDDANDYIAGFPSHPHRGFQTVTYMLDGHMLHKDHMGNTGHLKSGDVQWMIAGKGVIHSEMPQQKEGRMRGFQLWINLPASEKMQPADYKDISHTQMPWESLNAHCKIKIIAGEITVNNKNLQGPIQGLSMEPLMMDIILDSQQSLSIPLPKTHNAFIYLYEGDLAIDEQCIPNNTAVILTESTEIHLNTKSKARFLVLAGKPINEPIAQYGPFVMNTMEEVEQALRDYRSGTLTN